MSPNVFFKLTDFYISERRHKPALLIPTGEVASYGDLNRLMLIASRFFLEGGVQQHERIALVSSDGLACGMLALPIMEAATLAPLDDSLTEEGYLSYFNLLRADYLLTDEHCPPDALSVARATGMGIISFKYTGEIENLEFSFEWLEKATQKKTDPEKDQADMALLLTTSGTTSTPKVVPITYESILTSVEEKNVFFDFTEKDANLIIAKMFKGTSINSMLSTLLTGGQVVIMNGFKHQTLYRLINENKVSWFTASPAVLNAIVDDLQRSGMKITGSRLRFIRSSGAPLSLKMKQFLEAAFSAPVIQTYGMTETRTIASDYGAPKGFKEGSVGVTLGLDIKIEQGEIMVRGKGVFSGYEQTDSSASACFTDGWFHTGDLGYIDEDGYVFITGRVKEIINRGGEKISPYEVESAILKHPNIKDAAVFGFLNAEGMEDVGAAIVLQGDVNIDIKTLRRFLSGTVSSYKMPSSLYVLDQIPVHSSGKVQRKSLYLHLKNHEAESSVYASSEASQDCLSAEKNNDLHHTETLLIAMWQNLLKLKSIGVRDHFFECGGDSLSAAALFSFVEDQFGLQVPMNVFFNEPTIEALAHYISEAEGIRQKLRFLVPIKASGYKEPLYCVHTGDGEAVTYHHLGSFMDANRPVYALRFDLDYEGWEHPLTFTRLAEVYADEITRLDPIGPYHLCGTCFGGALAFEIAQVLHSKGYQVDTLAMFDALYSKGSNKYLRLLQNSLGELKEHSFKEILPLIIKKIGTAFKVFRTRRLKKSYGARIAQQSTVSPSNREKEAILSYAYSLYEPKPFHGRVYYFTSIKDLQKGTASEDYWKALCEDFVVVPMSCRHTEINNEANSHYLADYMSQIMEKDHA
ncbi:MAG: AMP-binding protein [Tissierellales bacterium]|nr:AMP-binding protein [Tissierellales bacterium]MBN2826684.1 AMP-binding protein [Tissierellales bacterium]